MRSLSILACLASLLLACGNSSSPKQVDDPAIGPSANESDAQATETPEEKFARQQTDTIDKMCQRLIDYSIEDAKKQMTPEALKELDVAKIRPTAIAKCTEEYEKTQFSARQLNGIRECLGVATESAVFNECLDSAGKGE